jgi:anti-sigma regulatory factor (Ser/Thr protein kinase)
MDEGRVWVCCEPVLRQEPPFEPSPAAVTRHLDLDPVPSSVGLARSFVRETLIDLDDEGQDLALLLTSELVTNAILHARTPVQVGLVVDGDRALVCVADRLPDSPELMPRPHSQDRPGGRGLALLADLAETWGTTSYAGGKTVWFVMRSDNGHDHELRAG